MSRRDSRAPVKRLAGRAAAGDVQSTWTLIGWFRSIVQGLQDIVFTGTRVRTLTGLHSEIGPLTRSQNGAVTRNLLVTVPDLASPACRLHLLTTTARRCRGNSHAREGSSQVSVPNSLAVVL